MLGQNLKDIRIKNKYNQEDIAEQLGVTKQTISNWEKGKRTPDIDSLVKLADIYQVTLDSLAGSDKRNECIELLNIISNMNEDKRNKLLNFLKVTV